ncbi:MAG: DUF3883 domain-containing protein [Clostridia bacterium]|nr:DUF3883 domain-containing protein [Clostridia bacterium]
MKTTIQKAIKSFDAVYSPDNSWNGGKSEKELEILRQQFVKDFPIDKMDELTPERYAIQTGKPEGKTSFCKRIEYDLEGLGQISGVRPIRYGVYNGNKKGGETGWHWANGTGENFDVIKDRIMKILEAAKSGNNLEIEKNAFGGGFTWKLLAVYFPEKYPNIFNESHVRYFLNVLFNNMSYGKSYLENAALLLEEKNRDPVMRNWSGIEFMRFLYSEFPEVKGKSDNEIDALSYKITDLILTEKTKGKEFSWRGHESDNSPDRLSIKCDYEQINKVAAAIGEVGEEAVVKYEKNKLKSLRRPDLAEKVERISKRSDSFGYDILSFDENGNELHIEVKSTTSKSVKQINFYISENEKETMFSDENYRIYYVYGIGYTNAFVEVLDVEAIKKHFSEVAMPVNYAVKINFVAG